MKTVGATCILILSLLVVTVCSAKLPPCTRHLSPKCNEETNSYGPNKCKVHQDCSSTRVCGADGYCEFPDNDLPACTAHTSKNCNEGLNSYGPNRCKTNDDCSGSRVCSFAGWCQFPVSDEELEGEFEFEFEFSGGAPSSPDQESDSSESSLPACTEHVSKTCDEGLNTYGPNRCSVNADCSGTRVCSYAGWCESAPQSSGEQSEQKTQAENAENAEESDQGLPACTSHVSKNCNEAKNTYGPNTCADNDDCSGARVCSYAGWCEAPSVDDEELEFALNFNFGDSEDSNDRVKDNVQSLPPCTDHVSPFCSEKLNSYGPKRCQVNDDCAEDRVCSYLGWCQYSDDDFLDY